MPEVLEVQEVPSEEVSKVPDVPTATNETLEVVVVLLSSLLLQEMTVRLIMVMRIICKIFFILSSIPKVKYYCLLIMYTLVIPQFGRSNNEVGSLFDFNE